MKNLIYLLFILISLCSCEKSDVSTKIINTNFKNHILAGYDVTSIAFDNLGNAWIGTYNAFELGNINKPKLIKYNIESNSTVIYDASNSLIKDSIYIWDIAVDSKNNVWIGCDGLIKFVGVSFTKYSSKNTKIPVDFVHSIVVDSKDNIWFSSSSRIEGGLVMYDGINWNVYTPDNSEISMNGVASIAIDKNDNIWLAQYRYLGETCLIKISNDTWTEYTSKELGFSPAYWGNIEINSKSQVCGAIDYSLTNPEYYNPRPQMIIFDGLECKQLQCANISGVTNVTIDNKDNIWCRLQNRQGIFDGGCLAVFNGNDWLIDSLTFEDTSIETIVQSKDNNIWIGTVNGIFINN
ncbi:MAG: two-component regulator propeller domain-containing protein [Bacteroidales bacterium]